MPKNIGVKSEKIISPLLKDVLTTWSKILNCALLFLLYAIVLAYLELFNLPAVLSGVLVIILVTQSHKAFWYFLQRRIISRMDFLKFLLALIWILWFFFLLLYAPFPAFSGRDEGSYANAAVYLARYGGIHFQLPLLSYLNSEGPAHQSLNFPGFVIKGDGLSSQFSPAYYVFLGLFFLVTQTVASFTLANGLLVLGGGTAFYLLLRLMFPRWVSFAGLLLILFHFLFLWFPRFTLSENLAFFLFFNLLLYLVLFRVTSDKAYILPVLLGAILLPITRPEGWWLLLTTCAMLAFWHYKRTAILDFSRLKKELLIFGGGLFLSIYSVFEQLPIYKRLVRDWLEWPTTSGSYQQLGSGSLSLGAVKNIIIALFPSWQRLWYFIKVEWIYGVLIFGFFAFALIIVYLWTRKSNYFSPRERIIIGIAAIMSFPFFTAFVSPQISPDHPWMLRRFFFVALPLGVLSALILGLNYIKKMPQNYNFPLISIFMAILLIPSFPAAGNFLTANIDEGRKEVLNQLSNRFKNNDYVFFQRESSGDGWHMWSEPLSSIYGINAAYVYSPKNITDLKQVLYSRISEGKRNFVVLPEQSFDFEHELTKNFNLILDKDFVFTNTESQISKSTENVMFPLLTRKEYGVKIYLLSPR
ncbi:MAG: hypothetical protein V1690_01205 [Candidatus Moraniibacteriota bacterium]